MTTPDFSFRFSSPIDFSRSRRFLLSSLLTLLINSFSLSFFCSMNYPNRALLRLSSLGSLRISFPCVSRFGLILNSFLYSSSRSFSFTGRSFRRTMLVGGETTPFNPPPLFFLLSVFRITTMLKRTRFRRNC